MDALTLKIIFMVGFVAMYAIRFPHLKANKQNKIALSKADGLEKGLLFLATLGMQLLPLLYVFTPLFGFADYDLPLWASIVGIALYATGIFMFWKSHHDLGRNWSVTLEVRESHELVTGGIYKRIRHPMYSAVWLIVIAQALLLPNAVGGLSGVACFGTLYFMRVGKEEKMMLDEFGAAYQTYMQKTGRIFPKLL